MIKKVDKLIEAEKFLVGMNPKERADFEKEIRSYNIAAVFSVRGCGSHGSRGLWNICSKPMIQWVLEAAQGSRYINKVAVVTEDRQIRDVVEKLNVLVIPRPLYAAKDYPRDYRAGFFKRPKPRSMLHLLADTQSIMPCYAVWHLMEMEGYIMDVRVVLAVNRPMVTTELIDAMIETAFAIPQAVCVNDCCFFTGDWQFINYEKSHMFRIFAEPFDRQEKFPICLSSVGVWVAPSQLDSQGGITIPFPISKEMALDVHDEEDLFLANCYMKRRLLKEGKEVKWEIE